MCDDGGFLGIVCSLSGVALYPRRDSTSNNALGSLGRDIEPDTRFTRGDGTQTPDHPLVQPQQELTVRRALRSSLCLRRHCVALLSILRHDESRLVPQTQKDKKRKKTKNKKSVRRGQQTKSESESRFVSQRTTI